MEKRIFILRRNDLQRNKTNLPIEKIRIYDFNSGAISIDEIRKTEQIIFVDNDQIKIKVLKQHRCRIKTIFSNYKLN